MSVFFISDLHLGHKNVIKFSPERQHFNYIGEHDEYLVEAWNKIVTKRDLVWVLGDVAWAPDALKNVGRMNGRKKLVMGNHDDMDTGLYWKYFESLHGVVSWKRNIVLSHVPIHNEEMLRWKINFHGHLHSKNMKDTIMYRNFSVEQCPNLAPVNWEDIRETL